MIDLFWSNLASSFWEAMNFAVWLVPMIFRVVKAILSPLFVTMLFTWLLLFAGWKQVSGTLKDKWESIGWEKEIITTHNARLAVGLIYLGVNAFIIVGFVLNFVFMVIASFIIFTVIKDYPEMMRNFQLLTAH